MTQAQLRPFWRAVGRAASALGIVGGEAVDEYRHRVMKEETGADHLRDIDPGDGFDKVMYRLAVDAGDWASAARFAVGSERRMSALVESCARQVIELKAAEEDCPFGDVGGAPREKAITYVVGILHQAGFRMVSSGEEWWMDISLGVAFTVFRILDTHRRRILRRLGWQGSMAFDIDAAWKLENVILTAVKAGDSPCPIRIGQPPAVA
ncbi:MAG: hypothetical protein IKO40_04060 [Kiritimatiellae bacterium]|nr:hypothetical protein [Kiritimatiellia bacterium]